MEAEKKLDTILINPDFADSLSALKANLPYSASKQKICEVFRLAVNGGLDLPDSKLDTWDVAFLFDQILELLQLLENKDALEQTLSYHEKIKA